MAIFKTHVDGDAAVQAIVQRRTTFWHHCLYQSSWQPLASAESKTQSLISGAGFSGAKISWVECKSVECRKEVLRCSRDLVSAIPESALLHSFPAVVLRTQCRTWESWTSWTQQAWKYTLLHDIYYETTGTERSNRETITSGKVVARFYCV